MEHILREIEFLPPSLILDGELYTSALTFQEIVGLVKKETLSAEDAVKHLKIEFHVYDIVGDAPYKDRQARLQALFDKFKFTNLKLVQTDYCKSREEMKALHDKYVSEGYEGIMLRNMNAGYAIGQRSIGLQKYKEFEDDDYEIVDFKEGEGLERGCVLWICKTPKGQLFSCRPRGTRESRETLFVRGRDYIGKNLTVRFQELTDEGVPRFPVGIAIRDYE